MTSFTIFSPMHEPSFFVDSVKLEVTKTDAEEWKGRLPLHLLKSQVGISVLWSALEEVLSWLQPQPHVELLQHSHEYAC